MKGIKIERRFTALEPEEKSADYNFNHFTTKIPLTDLQRTAKSQNIEPGEPAPDFKLWK